MTLEAIFGHRDRVGVEGVGLDDIRTGLEVLEVDVLNNRRLGDVQDVVAKTQIPLVAGELLAAIVRLFQLVGLDHGAHGAVNDDNASL